MSVIFHFSIYIHSIYSPNSIGSIEHTDFLEVLFNSRLIYDPKLREQIWRFFTYMLLHGDMRHLLWNLTMQLLVGNIFFERANFQNNAF